MRRLPTFQSFLFALLSIALGTAATAQVSMTMEIQQDKKGKHIEKNDVSTTMVSDGERGAIITGTADGQVMILIVDPGERHTTTIITDKDGKQSAVRMPSIKLPKGQQDRMTFDGNLEATGETKEVLGYPTEKYIVRQQGDVTEVWVADIPGYDAQLFADGLGHGGNASGPDVEGMSNPVALESHTTSKNGKEVTHMYIREIAVGGDVDLSALEVPAGVELNDMSALLQGFGG